MNQITYQALSVAYGPKPALFVLRLAEHRIYHTEITEQSVTIMQGRRIRICNRFERRDADNAIRWYRLHRTRFS